MLMAMAGSTQLPDTVTQPRPASASVMEWPTVKQVTVSRSALIPAKRSLAPEAGVSAIGVVPDLSLIHI